MSRGVNKWVGIGFLGADPEMRSTPSGMSVTNARMAINEYGGKDKPERTVWLDIVFFGRQAEVAAEHLRKGSQIYVDGRVAVDDWEAQDGTKRRTYKIVANEFQFVGGKGEGGERAERKAPREQARKPAAADDPDDWDDSDLPF